MRADRLPTVETVLNHSSARGTARLVLVTLAYVQDTHTRQGRTITPAQVAIVVHISSGQYRRAVSILARLGEVEGGSAQLVPVVMLACPSGCDRADPASQQPHTVRT